MYKNLKEPIIFLGFGRSGTTIISEIIFSHPDLAWVSNYQNIFPRSKLINLVRSLFHNPLWKVYGQKKQLNNVSPINKYIFKPAESYKFWETLCDINFARSFLINKQVDVIREKYIHSHFSSMIKLQNRKRLSFKITGPSRLEYLHSIFPDAKFIWIKRKPLPNIRSLLNVGFYQNRKNILWWNDKDIYSKEELKNVKDWKNQPELIAALQYFKIHKIFNLEKDKLNIANQIIEINYEDFIANPKIEIENILRFINLPSSKEIDKYLEDNKIFNRNIKKEYFFSPELDQKVKNIAITGVL